MVNFLFLICAGYGLWRLWRLAAGSSSLFSRIIAGGLVVRGITGMALFWISYLALPVARSLQAGNGFWFFGIDGTTYYAIAEQAAAGGPIAILGISDTTPSAVYVRLLAIGIWLLGEVPSVALLLNAGAYLGAAALIVEWARRNSVPTTRTAIPLFAISFLPAWILWSVQPLKDTVFCFFIILFAASMDSFLRGWQADVSRETWKLVRAGALLAVSIYALAGIRWYYAVLALAAWSTVMCALLGTRVARRGWLPRAVVATSVFIVMWQLLLLGAGPYIPTTLRSVFHPFAPQAGRLSEVVEDARDNLSNYSTAGTRLRTASAVERLERSLAASPARAPRGSDVLSSELTAADLPRTIQGRLITGLAALLLPRFIAQNVGLVNIGGGRGFWWFADIDTIATGLLLVTIATSLRRKNWREPMAWYALIATAMIGAATAYTISNFGALFRHRQMFVATALLLLVCVSRSSVEDRPAACGGEERTAA
ncbi:MAG TPA: hypothetical protein VKB93_03485 [Thermoanaerobaculia bacterium]|nr:hypothetical protein [Thermoanaerobaculia bacterium]